MKKVLVFSNLAWMLAVMLIIASASSKKPTLTSAFNTPPPTCDPGPVAFMSPDAFLKGIARYRKYQWTASNDKINGEGLMNNKFEDARSCWYSIDELNSFICLVKQKATENGFDPATTEMGIRFYYASYPDTEHQTVFVPIGDPNPKHISVLRTQVNVGMHHTLFMVPTIQNNETKLDEPIFMTVSSKVALEQPLKIKRESVLHPQWNLLLKNTQARILVLGQAASTPSSGNQGGLCPPNCPTGSSLLSQADALYSNTLISQH